MRALAFGPWTIALSVGCGPSVGPTPVEGDEPQRYGEAVCAALAECQCYSPHSSRVACEDEYASRLAALMELNADFDGECFEQVLKSAELLECQVASDAPFAVQCTLIQGESGAGDACSGHFGVIPPFEVDECQGDLVCRGGACRSPDDVLPLSVDGSPCDYTEFGTRCPSSPDVYLYCSTEGACRPQAEPGSACSSPDGCKFVDLPGYYCAGLEASGEGSCQQRVDIGEACAPADVDVCAYAGDLDEAGWCDFQLEVCVADLPKVCGYPSQR
jgi:hypothetical protein